MRGVWAIFFFFGKSEVLVERMKYQKKKYSTSQARKPVPLTNKFNPETQYS